MRGVWGRGLIVKEGFFKANKFPTKHDCRTDSVWLQPNGIASLPDVRGIALERSCD